MIEQFHFLRPEWLLALVIPCLVLWILRHQRHDSGNWRSVIDARLLPYVLSGEEAGGGKHLSWIMIFVVTLAIIALAGPTWEKRQQSVYQQGSALVIALDLSRSMDATDIRPTRLTRARHKIADILNLRKEGQSALVVYAADAFAVTPLTTDVDTILALLPGLETSMMPAQGTRADRALERALELFDNSTVQQGDLLLVTDGLSDLEAERIEALLVQHPGQRVSVLAVGTPGGGPVPLSNGDFLKDRQGAIVITRLQVENMRRIAGIGNGAYATISTDDIDINTLSYLMESRFDDDKAQLSGRSTDLWRELGPSLLLFVLPFAALAFRRGLIWLAPVFLLVLPPDAEAFDWQSVWSNSDQQGMEFYQQGEHQQAAEMFNDEAWQATARYRAGDYAAAAEAWQQLDGADAGYNHAGALAQQGLFEEALAAYDSLLEQNPDHQDARFNRQAIEDWLKQQQQQDDESSQQQSGESQQDEQQSGEAQQDEQQSGQSSQQDSSDDKSDSGQESEANQSSADQNNSHPWEQARQGGQGWQEPQTDPSTDNLDDESGDELGDESAQQEGAQPDESESQQQGESQANLDQQMSEQAAQQWLRKIPDDPGGLLRRKFLYQYRQRDGVQTDEPT